MFLMFLTFVVTSALYAALLVLAFRRVARHLEDKPEARQIVIEHVLVPLLWKPREQSQDEPETPAAEGEKTKERKGFFK